VKNATKLKLNFKCDQKKKLKFEDFFHKRKKKNIVKECLLFIFYFFSFSQNFTPKNTSVDTMKNFRDIGENKLEHS
jgi:hypothetical protein